MGAEGREGEGRWSKVYQGEACKAARGCRANALAVRWLEVDGLGAVLATAACAS